MRSQLKTIFDQDLPPLPPHWHTACQCAPTVAYVRVSKIGKRTKITSPKIQLDEIIKDARINNRRIVKIVFDINVSGSNFDREALNEVMADLKAGTYRHISVWKWSRWGRNLRGSLQMLALVEDLGARVDSATEPFDQGSVWGEFGRDQMLLIADIQGKMIGQTWRSVHNNRREHHLPHSGRKKFGYDYNGEDERDKFYAVNEAESDALAWAYGAYLSGVSMRKIAGQFTRLGLTTEFGNPWTQQGVGKMMDTGFAAGLIRGRTDEQKKLMKRKPANTLASYDKWDPGKQPVLIDMDVWKKYKAKRLSMAGTPPRSRTAAHVLSSLLFCSLCARRMSTKYAGSARQHQWKCTWQGSFHPGRSVSVSNAGAMEVVREWFDKRSEPEWLEGEARKAFERAAATKPEINTVAAQIRELDRAINKQLDLLEAVEDGNESTKTRLLGRINANEAKLVTLKEREAELSMNSGPAADYRAVGVISARWDEFDTGTHHEALSNALGMVLVSPLPDPSKRGATRDRVQVVPLWEMAAWSDWLGARRQRSA